MKTAHAHNARRQNKRIMLALCSLFRKANYARNYAGIIIAPLVSVDDLLIIDIFCHFKHSSKRWSEFDFSDIKPLSVLKHCSTCWLSLERCIKCLIDQWPPLFAYFDRQIDATSTYDRVCRVAKQLRDPEVKLVCHFVSYGLKLFNKFSIAFQTHASHIGTLQSDVCKLLQAFMSNFIDPKVMKGRDDVTSINYMDRSNQACNSELGIGTSTRMLLCGELEDEVVGTSVETRFFKRVCEFYETAVSKISAKFPFADPTVKELAFLDPHHRDQSSSSGLVGLATHFTHFTTDEIDTVAMEFRDYQAASDTDLPEFDPREYAGIDHFWAAMADVRSVADLHSFHFGVLSSLAKILLVLPHSNTDPEILFSMVRKIQTEQRKQNSSTLCDLLCVKVNNANPCYGNQLLMTQTMLSSAKSATR